MKTLRVLHFADVHLDDSTMPNSLAALDSILAIAERERPDLIVNAGDLGMRRGHLPPWVALELRKFHVALARIAPTVVVEGNHDMVHDDRAGTVLGALAEADAPLGMLRLVTRPEVVRFPGLPLAIACLPYPSKKRLMLASDVSATLVNDAMARALVEITHGLAVECARFPDEQAVLVFHGTIDGAKFGDERTMTTEMDALLPEPEIPAIFGAIMAGHIHKPQAIGRASYSGSPAPLSFSEEGYDHGALIWELGDLPADFPVPTYWVRHFHAIEPAQRLLTVDMRELALGQSVEVPTLDDGKLAPNTRLRVLVRIGRNESAAEVEARIRENFAMAGATEIKVVIERTSDNLEARGDRPEVTHDGEIGDALKLWAERSPEAAADLPALLGVAGMIEAGLPPEARSARNAAEYTLESITVSNWKSYGPGPLRLDLEALGSLVVIEGENASGKSNLMEAEAFALWGRTIRGRQTLAELVRKGATDARVRATFRSGGELWLVDRAIRLKANGTAAAELSLSRWAPSVSHVSLDLNGEASLGLAHEWTPASAGTAAETEAKIATLVGSLDLYLSTRFASQGDIDRLLSLTPAELKDTLQEALNTGAYGLRERAAAEVLAKTVASLESARVVVAGMERRTETMDALSAELDDARTKLAASEAEVDRLRAEERDARDQVVRAEEALRNGDARRQSFKTARQSLADQAAAVERIKGSRRVLEADRDAGAAAAKRVDELAAMRERSVVLEAQTETQRAARLNLAGLEEAAKQAADNLSRVVRQCNASRSERIGLQRREADAATTTLGHAARALTQARQALVDLMARNKAELRSLEDRGARASMAPFGEKCVEVKCALIADAIAARAAVEPKRVEHRAQEAAAERAIHEAFEAHNKATADFADEKTRSEAAFAAGTAADDALAAEATARSVEAHARFDAARASVGTETEQEVELRTIRETYARENTNALHERAAKGRAAAERLASLEEDLDRAVALERQAYDALAALSPEPDDDGDRLRLDVTRSTAGLCEATRETEERNRSWHAERVATMAARLEETERIARDLIAARARLNDMQAVANTLRLYQTAVGKSGLPYMILERSLPALERHANAFLGAEAGDVDLRVEIEPFREISTGERRTEVLIRYRNRFGLHSLAAASGFERAALGYALRAAMAQVQAEAHGIKVTHFVADEGWGAFDENNLLMGQRMLQRMAQEFRRVIFVSHVGTIREIAESRVTVTPDGANGSTFEVQP